MSNVAIVTGAASGIGRALAEELAKQGVEVVLADRQIDASRALADEIRNAGGKAVAVELDVRDAAQFQRVVDDAVQRSGRVDYLFNNAGIGVAGDMDTYTLQDWNDVLDVNIRGVVHGIHSVYRTMRAQGSGHIVNTASMAGLCPGAGAGNYTASKHAVVGLSKALRIEAKEHGVRVSVLCPGVIRTAILTGGKYGRLKHLEGAEEKATELWERLRPMDPNQFAKKTLKQVAKNNFYVIVPGWWRAFWYLDRLSPALSMKLWERLYHQAKKELTPFEVDHPTSPTLNRNERKIEP